MGMFFQVSKVKEKASALATSESTTMVMMHFSLSSTGKSWYRMAAPWHNFDFPFSVSKDTNSNKVKFSSDIGGAADTENNNIANNGQEEVISRNKTLWKMKMNSVRNIVVKSNNLFKLPERVIAKGYGSEEEEQEEENLYHSGLVNKAFMPMRIALIGLGRWPFPMRMVQVTTKRHRKGHHHHHHLDHRHCHKRVRNYVPTLKTVLWVYYACSTCFLLYTLMMSMLGFFNFFLGWNILGSNVDVKMFQNNLVLFLLVWGCLVHSVLSSFSFFVNRKKLVRILNYWNVAVDELLIDEVKSHRRFLITANVGYIVFLVLVYVAYSTWQITFVRQGAELFGTLALLPLLKIIDKTEENIEKWQLRVFGIITIIYAIYGSRCFLFMFSFKCRLLRSLFRVWNGRLVRFLKEPERNPNEEKDIRENGEKLESERLLSDMAILLKMVKLTDKMFAIILQAYYAIQLLNMCFELYMLAKSGSDKDVDNAEMRGLNIFSAILTLCQNVYFFFTVSLDGAYVGEEAQKGMEVLRRYAIKPSSSIHRKYLIYNLGFIYSQRITVTGGKYFNIDRPFILTVLGAVLTYFVIILQVGPTFQKFGSDNGNETST